VLHRGCFHALLDFDDLPRVAERGDVRPGLFQVPEADVALGKPAHDDFRARLDFELVLGGELDFVFSRKMSALLRSKPKRLASSWLAWLTAFSISIGLTCETMSNEGIATAKNGHRERKGKSHNQFG